MRMTEAIIIYIAASCFISFFSVTGAMAKSFKNSNKEHHGKREKKAHA